MRLQNCWFICMLCMMIACKQTITNPAGKLPDKAWIKHQLLMYDSVYNIFYATDRISDSSLSIRVRSHIYLDSILVLQDSFEVIKDTATSKLLLQALYFKGTDLNDMGRYADAEIFLNKYLVLSDDIKAPASKVNAYIHKTLGDIYSRLGDYTLAIYHKKKSLAYYENINDVEDVSSEIINLSPPFYETGLYDSAIFYLKKGLALKGVADKRMLAIYTELASNYIKKNDTINAVKALQNGKLYFIKIKSSNTDFEKLFAYNNTYAELLKMQKNYSQAIPLLKQSLQFISIAYGNFKNRNAGKTYNQLGNDYELMHNKDSSIYYYNLALYTVTNIDTNNIFSVPDKNELYAENTIMEALDYKAGWMMNYCNNTNAKKYLQCAVNCYDEIMDVEYKLLQYFSYDDSKLLMLQDSRLRSETAIEACYKLNELDKNRNWVEKAFSFAERNKSFILLESIKRNLVAVKLNETDSNYNKLQSAQLNYANAEKELIEAKSKNDPAVIRLAVTNLQNADEVLQSVKLKVNAGNSSYKTLFEKEDSISNETVKKLLQNNHEAIAEYFIGSHAAYCFYISKSNTVAMFKLDESLSSATDSLLAFFKDKNAILQHVQLYSNAAYRIYTLLKLPVITNNVTKLVIIPDEKLNYVPFDALLTTPAKSFNLSSFSYLIKHCDITYNYSAMIMLHQENYKYPNNNLVAFSPVFKKNQLGLSTLQFADEEIKGLKKVYKHGEYYEGNNATTTMFKKNAPSAGIIHIASHASSEGIPRIEFYDSTLYLDELYAMRLNANLVVLSGCETGTGEMESSEGVISLARGFYYAGAHSVITSLWSVDDNSTATLFTNFYNDLDKNNYGETLRQSKLDYLQSAISNDKFSPYYWAAFIYIGNSDDINKSFVADNMIFIVLTIFLLAIIIIIFFKRRFKQ